MIEVVQTDTYIQVSGRDSGRFYCHYDITDPPSPECPIFYKGARCSVEELDTLISMFTVLKKKIKGKQPDFDLGFLD